jgi:flagellar assembly protein FliH
MSAAPKHDEARPWLIPEMEARSVNSFLIEERRAKPTAMPTVEELAQLRASAREEGYREGYEEAYKKGYAKGELEARVLLEKELHEKREAFAQLLNALARPLEQMDESAEHALVQLSLSVAKLLIRRELHADPGQVVAVMREAILLLPQARQSVRIAMHPDDAHLVRELFVREGANANWQVIDDPSQTRGGCKVSTDDSFIDASVESRIAAIVAHVFAASDQFERIITGKE